MPLLVVLLPRLCSPYPLQLEQQVQLGRQMGLLIYFAFHSSQWPAVHDVSKFPDDS